MVYFLFSTTGFLRRASECTHAPARQVQGHMSRVGQNRMYSPYMTVYLVNPLPRILYIYSMYMVLANPTYE